MIRNLLRLQQANVFKRSYAYIEFSQSAIMSENVKEAVNVDPTTHVGYKAPVKSFATIPLANNLALQSKYENVFGAVRIGKLLEDVDAMAGRVAYLHCDGFNVNRQLTVVTANVDKIAYNRHFRIDRSIRLEGEVTHTGNSSMEVRVLATSDSDDGDRFVGLECYLVMVARERYASRSALVHRLQPETAEQHELFEKGVQKTLARKQKMETRLSEKPPTAEESALVHDIFRLRHSSIVQGNWLSIGRTALSLTGIMHPEYKNLHGKIFGMCE
jgi:acyl-coenzyme A thioesterase 9